MADCYYHGYSGGPGPCPSCERERTFGPPLPLEPRPLPPEAERCTRCVGSGDRASYGDYSNVGGTDCDDCRGSGLKRDQIFTLRKGALTHDCFITKVWNAFNGHHEDRAKVVQLIAEHGFTGDEQSLWGVIPHYMFDGVWPDHTFRPFEEPFDPSSVPGLPQAGYR